MVLSRERGKPKSWFGNNKSSPVQQRAVSRASSLDAWQSQVFLGLFLGYLALAGSRAGISVAAPDMMQPVSEGGFGLTKTEVGALLSSFTMAYGPSKFIGGMRSPDLCIGEKLVVERVFSCQAWSRTWCLVACFSPRLSCVLGSPTSASEVSINKSF